MTDLLRVAAGQFAATADLDENLASCLRLIEGAAAQDSDLIVLPEFANHISVYRDLEHCRSVAVDLEGPWIGAVAAKAQKHSMYVSFAVTIPQGDGRVTITNVLIGPDGSIAATADKQTLMGNEREYLSGGDSGSEVAATNFGSVGIYACMDGVTFETPRTFAVRGARLMLNSLNSFAVDEAALHIPVRAVENGVFVVASNKVGPLLPAEQVEAFSKALGVPPEALNGAGESQIVAPDGTVVAMASRTDEALIVADIDLSAVAPADERFANRRPEIYEALAKPDSTTPRGSVPDEVTVQCLPVGDGGLTDRAQLVVLPELSAVPETIPTDVLVVTSAYVGNQHVGQIWSSEGLLHSQAQLHQSERHPTVTELGDQVDLFAAPWGDVALVVGEDHRHPEVFRLAAIQGAHAVVVLYRPTDTWQTDLAIRERAAENRVCLVACAPPGEPAATMVLNPPADSLWSPERSKPYDGTINTPDAVVASALAPRLDAVIYPKRALQREISRNTDLVGGRSWQASAELVR